MIFAGKILNPKVSSQRRREGRNPSVFISWYFSYLLWNRWKTAFVVLLFQFKISPKKFSQEIMFFWKNFWGIFRDSKVRKYNFGNFISLHGQIFFQKFLLTSNSENSRELTGSLLIFFLLNSSFYLEKLLQLRTSLFFSSKIFYWKFYFSESFGWRIQWAYFWAETSTFLLISYESFLICYQKWLLLYFSFNFF